MPHVSRSCEIRDLVIRDWEDIWQRETMKMLLINQSNRVIGQYVLGIGGISSVLVDVRVALRTALKTAAVSIALVHNHPSGKIEPSDEDDKLTKKFKNAFDALDIRLLDHIIINGEGKYYSYADEYKIV